MMSGFGGGSFSFHYGFPLLQGPPQGFCDFRLLVDMVITPTDPPPETQDGAMILETGGVGLPPQNCDLRAHRIASSLPKVGQCA